MNRTPSAGSMGTSATTHHFHKNGITDTSTPNNVNNGTADLEDPYGKLQVEVNMHELLEEPVEELVSHSFTH